MVSGHPVDSGCGTHSERNVGDKDEIFDVYIKDVPKRYVLKPSASL